MRPYWISALLLMAIVLGHGEPAQKQIAQDAFNFRQFRLQTLATASVLSRKHPGSNDGTDFIGRECQKLARHTSPQYLYGVFFDLSQDTSRTEEPYLIAEMLALTYPHEDARHVLQQIQKQHGSNRGEIQA